MAIATVQRCAATVRNGATGAIVGTAADAADAAAGAAQRVSQVARNTAAGTAKRVSQVAGYGVRCASALVSPLTRATRSFMHPVQTLQDSLFVDDSGALSRAA